MKAPTASAKGAQPSHVSWCHASCCMGEGHEHEGTAAQMLLDYHGHPSGSLHDDIAKPLSTALSEFTDEAIYACIESSALKRPLFGAYQTLDALVRLAGAINKHALTSAKRKLKKAS